MEYTGYPVIQFGSFRQNVGCRDATTSKNSPSNGSPRRTLNQTPRRTPGNSSRGNSPRGQYSPRSPVKYNNIQEQLDFASRKYEKVLNKYMRTPCRYITEKQEEDVWAWGIFSEVVLPMLKIIDEE